MAVTPKEAKSPWHQARRRHGILPRSCDGTIFHAVDGLPPLDAPSSPPAAASRSTPDEAKDPSNYDPAAILASLTQREKKNLAKLDKRRNGVVDNSGYDGAANVKLHLQDINPIPLLQPHEEVALANARKAGAQAAERLQHLPDHAPQRVSLEVEVALGEAARMQLLKSNSRLCVKVARNYIGKGMPLGDLIQEGNLGLLRAVEKYDPQRGFRFSTFAYWWIRQAVSRAVTQQARVIRIPVYVIEQLGLIYCAYRELSEKLEREPTNEEIGERIGLNANKVSMYRKAAENPISLETPVGDEQNGELADFIPDESLRPHQESAERADMRSKVEAALTTLNVREQAVLRMRFGLSTDGASDGEDKSLSEIGEELGVSRERVRQIEAEALGKLRQPKFRAEIREYLE